MAWVVTALASAAIGAAVSTIDKTLLQNYLRSHITLQLIIGILQGLSGIVFTVSFAWSGGVFTVDALLAFISGSIFGFSGLILLYVLKHQEVSRVIPISQTAPVFAAVLAFMFLGETLLLVQWLAVIVTVLGAMLLSIQPEMTHGRLSLQRSFLPLMVASLTMAAGYVIVKTPLYSLPVPLIHGMRSLGLSAVFLAFSAIKKDARRELISMIQKRSSGVVLVLVSEVGLVNGSFLLLLWAISSGPVGLVTALVSTRSVFVLFYSTTLSLRFKGLLAENVTSKLIMFKLFAVTLIVIAITIITVS